MDDLLAMLQGSLIRRESLSDILGVNIVTAQTGLIFSPSQAAALLKARDLALEDSGRLELGSGIVKKLILAFYASPFFQNEQAEDTLYALMDIFYHLKNETFDVLGDDELICFMRERFDGECRGSLELMRDDAFQSLVRRMHGAPSKEAETGGGREENEDE